MEYLECIARIAKDMNYQVIFWFNYLERADFVSLLVNKLAALGVPQSCLRFGARLEPKSRHFARLAVSDLALDTFNVNMASGALDCMWAGTPVISLVGENYTSRTCGAFNKLIGLEDLNVKTQQEYVEKALQLAQQPELLARASQRLHKNKADCPMFNGAVYAENLCAGLKLAIDRSRLGKPPKHIDVPA